MSQVHVETLRKAAAILGSEEKLEHKLGVQHSDLSLWLSGKIDPPCDVFLRAVDIVQEHSLIELSGPRVLNGGDKSEH